MRAPRLLLMVALVAALAGCGDGAPTEDGPDLPAREIRVDQCSGELPVADPFAAEWDRAREVVVMLLPQDVAQPRLVEKGEETLRLRAMHDGRTIAFRLVWADDAPHDLVDVDRSSDAVAIQVPANGEGPVPDSMMGEVGKPVSIALWRASWQRRVDGGSHGVEALYPNALIDHYPPQAAKDPEMRARLERLYEPPVAVGNPVAAPTLVSAVEDLVAEGFGTLRTADEQRAGGRGAHRDGRWHVVITRPLDLQPGAASRLRPGQSTFLAVAVWNGGANQRGSLKMRSIWVPLEIREAGQ